MKIIKFLKDFLLYIPITLIFYPLNKLMLFISHFNLLILWIYKNKKHILFCDFYSFKRNYKKRFLLYDFVMQHLQLESKKIIYLEFGVANGSSLQYWINKNDCKESSFYGFDTFEGLPENWGHFKKGDMNSRELNIEGNRVTFIKGLFQNTLYEFVNKNAHNLNDTSFTRVIHLDADLYSSTSFVLSQIHWYIRAGDIIIFDEFSVAMHEFKAFNEYSKIFYRKFKPIASVNNFLQVAFIVE